MPIIEAIIKTLEIIFSPNLSYVDAPSKEGGREEGSKEKIAKEGVFLEEGEDPATKVRLIKVANIKENRTFARQCPR